MNFDSLIIYASLATAIISVFVFTYSSITAKRGYPDITGAWSLTLCYGPSSAYYVVRGHLIIKRQFLGELHGRIETENSTTDFKGSINRHGMIQGIYSTPMGISGNLMLLLNKDRSGANGQYMTANQSGSITQGMIILERKANKIIQPTQ